MSKKRDKDLGMGKFDLNAHEKFLEERLRMYKEKIESQTQSPTTVPDEPKLKPNVEPAATNVFSNDGSFMDQFRKLSGLQDKGSVKKSNVSSESKALLQSKSKSWFAKTEAGAKSAKRLGPSIVLPSFKSKDLSSTPVKEEEKNETSEEKETVGFSSFGPSARQAFDTSPQGSSADELTKDEEDTKTSLTRPLLPLPKVEPPSPEVKSPASNSININTVPLPPQHVAQTHENIHLPQAATPQPNFNTVAQGQFISNIPAASMSGLDPTGSKLHQSAFSVSYPQQSTAPSSSTGAAFIQQTLPPNLATVGPPIIPPPAGSVHALSQSVLYPSINAQTVPNQATTVHSLTVPGLISAPKPETAGMYGPLPPNSIPSAPSTNSGTPYAMHPATSQALAQGMYRPPPPAPTTNVNIHTSMYGPPIIPTTNIHLNPAMYGPRPPTTSAIKVNSSIYGSGPPVSVGAYGVSQVLNANQGMYGPSSASHQGPPISTIGMYGSILGPALPASVVKRENADEYDPAAPTADVDASSGKSAAQVSIPNTSNGAIFAISQNPNPLLQSGSIPTSAIFKSEVVAPVCPPEDEEIRNVVEQLAVQVILNGPGAEAEALKEHSQDPHYW